MNPKLRHRLISEWTGLTLPSLDALIPVDLNAVFQKSFTRLGLANRLRESTLADNWAEVVGPTLSPHCAPGAVRRGVLSIRVDHPAWLHQIALAHKADILKTIQEKYPQLRIKDLLLRIG